MPSKTYAQLTLQTSIQAPGDLAAAYPTGGPLYGLTWRNVFLSIDRVSATGLATPLITTASVAGAAGFNVPVGVAPTTPNAGDIWTTASGFFVRYGGATQQMLPLSGGTLTGELITVASGSTAGFNVPHGSAPAAPVNGDVWTTTAGVFARVNGVTIQLSAGTVVPFDANPMLFGDASDGNVTISGSTTLSRDMYYNNLTIAAGAALNTAGFKIFVAGILDLTAAPAAGIQLNGAAGGNSVAQGAGAAGAATAQGSTTGGGGITLKGQVGKAGGTGAGSAGTAVGAVIANGGGGGNAGAGGAGSSGGGAAATSGAVTAQGIGAVPTLWPVATLSGAGAPTLVSGAPAQGGAAGGAGGGDGANNGGGSGAGGSPGGIVAIFAATINRGAGTAVGAIQVLGGAAGTSTGAAAGNAGGAGGSGGGGGGWVLILCRTLSGATATNCIDTTGGNGSAGGAGLGTGVGGDGGASGAAGAVHIACLSNSTFTRTAGAASVAGGAHSGVTGGTAGTATTNRVSL